MMYLSDLSPVALALPCTLCLPSLVGCSLSYLSCCSRYGSVATTKDVARVMCGCHLGSLWHMTWWLGLLSCPCDGGLKLSRVGWSWPELTWMTFQSGWGWPEVPFLEAEDVWVEQQFFLETCSLFWTIFVHLFVMPICVCMYRYLCMSCYVSHIPCMKPICDIIWYSFILH